MQRVGEFEKVSYRQYLDAVKDCCPDMSDVSILSSYNNLELPTRATSGSAGYDFKAPFAISLLPGQTVKIPTGIRVKIDDGWWLGCLPRSGLGFKYHLRLANTVGVIDSDYYYSDNEGHIFVKMTNCTPDDKTLFINPGDGFMQAIFIPYGITYSDEATSKRNGGFGSTGR